MNINLLLRMGTLGSLLLTSACYVDNQKIATPEDQQLVNPAPMTRDFAANNAKHKVLMAVIDTGIDYNHPYLQSQIHFSLDATGKPQGLGKDYVGDDSWPAPYLARTSLYDPGTSAEDLKKSQAEFEGLSNLVATAPDLAKYFAPHRNTNQEQAEGTYHGTHVSGLMVYDRPDFGLMGYRVLPSNFSPDPAFDYTADSMNMIVSAINQAAADGAKVVNMSLGLDFDKATKADDGADKEAEFLAQKAYYDKISEAINSHPDVLYVTAAGNDGAWRDASNKLGMPCGIKAPNLLCVGALRENGEPATFTNIQLGNVDVVFTLGQNVISTMPSGMCTTPSAEQALSFDRMEDSVAKAMLVESFRKDCAQASHLGKLSGTSMASPLIAHLAGEILAAKPSLGPKQVIKEIRKRSMPDFIGTLPVYKFKIKKPSWYAPAGLKETTAFLNNSLKPSRLKINDSAYFEGFTARKLSDAKGAIK
ncbi:S8 family serine peptidase [Bdellovibrionota bacterium FG-2]